MTRHRDSVRLYVDAEEFLGRAGGKLLDHGAAPYKHQAGNRESYFVTLENDKGQRSTVWGVELGQAMRDTQPAMESGSIFSSRALRPSCFQMVHKASAVLACDKG